MRLRQLLPIASIAVAAVAARPVAAQVVPAPVRIADDDAWAAYNALTLTPDGALAPSAGFLLSRPGESLGALRVSARVGGGDRNAFTEQRAYAISLDAPVGVASLALTAGYVDFSCDELVDANGEAEDCRGGWHAGARLGRSLWSYSLDAAGTSVLVVGAEASAGYADATLFEVDVALAGSGAAATYTAFSGTLGLPVGVRTSIGRVTVAPMVAPRIAYGRATLDVEGISRDTDGGPRFVLGAGVAVRLGRYLGLDAGLQRVHVSRAGTMYGVSASVGF